MGIHGRPLSVWEEYRQTIYGFIQDDEDEREPSGFSYAQMEARDERRWRLADGDHDGKLTKAEFQDFLHPEDADHMRDIVVTETIEDIDKDGDSLISMNEYIGDMYHADSDDDLEPDWVTSEKEQFKEYRDKNGDGFMDAEEVKAWIVPQDFDPAKPRPSTWSTSPTWTGTASSPRRKSSRNTTCLLGRKPQISGKLCRDTTSFEKM